jgi:ABC-2 type transport system permease protein
MAKSYEGAGVFSYLLLGLMFVSSAFVPTNNMATGLRAFAEHQPMTPLAEALRSLFAGQLNAGALITALLWCLGVALVFYVVSLAVYRRREG